MPRIKTLRAMVRNSISRILSMKMKLTPLPLIDLCWRTDEQADRGPSRGRGHRAHPLLWHVSVATFSTTRCRFVTDARSCSTEIGAVVRLIPNPKTMDKPEWDYFEISPHVDIRLIPQEEQPGIFEPIVFVSIRYHTSADSGEFECTCLRLRSRTRRPSRRTCSTP